MAMVVGLTAQVRWLGLRVDSCLCAALHSSNEPSELSTTFMPKLHLFDLLWTCCSVAANQRADVDDVLVT